MNRRALLILCLIVAVDTGSFGLLAPVLPFLVAKLTGSLNTSSRTTAAQGHRMATSPPRWQLLQRQPAPRRCRCRCGPAWPCCCPCSH